MKATLTFDLPEEQEEFDLACSARKLAAAVDDFAQYLRQHDKYGDQTTWPNLAELRAKFWECLSERNVGEFI